MFKTSTFRAAATLAAMCLSGPAWALGSTPVTVVNPADIAKAEEIQQPYADAISCTFTNNCPQFGNSCQGKASVPATQRLILEFVAGGCTQSRTINFIQIRTQFSADIFSDLGYQLVLQPPVNPISQPVRLYAFPSTEISFFVSADPGAGSCSLVFSGQAVAVP
jgi:hypothetical protein